MNDRLLALVPAGDISSHRVNRKKAKVYNMCMQNKTAYWAVVGLLVGLLGCDDSSGNWTARPLVRDAATNACEQTLSSNRVAFVRETHGKGIVLERPAPLGLDADEYAKLAAFSDELIFAKAKPCVECLSLVLCNDADFFSLAVYRSRAGDPSALANRSKSEYEGLSRDDILPSDVRLATFSRRLGRRLAFDDVFVPESVPLVQKEIVAFLSNYAPILPAGVPQALAAVSTTELRAGLDNFAIEESVAQMAYVRIALPGHLVGIGGRHLEVRCNLPDEVFRKGMIPSCETVAPQGAGGGGAISYDRIVHFDYIPPAFDEENGQCHELKVRVEYPVGGFPSAADPLAVASFMGSVLTEGMVTGKTVEASIGDLRRNFRKKCVEEDTAARQKGETGMTWFDSCEGRMLFMDSRYIAYQNSYQHGCPSGSGETNGVFSFVLNRALTIRDFIRPESRESVCQLLRRQAVADRNATGVSDSLDLPSYVKADEWPKTLDNFFIDMRGITWSYPACFVYAGSNCFSDTTLTWRQLLPYLVSPDLVPSGPRQSRGA